MPYKTFVFINNPSYYFYLFFSVIIKLNFIFEISFFLLNLFSQKFPTSSAYLMLIDNPAFGTKINDLCILFFIYTIIYFIIFLFFLNVAVYIGWKIFVRLYFGKLFFLNFQFKSTAISHFNDINFPPIEVNIWRNKISQWNKWRVEFSIQISASKLKNERFCRWKLTLIFCIKYHSTKLRILLMPNKPFQNYIIRRKK